MWTCSRAWAAAYLPGSFSDGQPSQHASLTPGVASYLYGAKTTPRSRPSLSGTTSAPFPAAIFGAAWTSYQGAFPARMSARPGLSQKNRSGICFRMGNTLKQDAAVYGLKCSGSSEKPSPATHSLKTSQPCEVEGLIKFCETLTRAGLMLRGTVSKHPTWAPPTNEIDSGSWPGQETDPDTENSSTESALRLLPTPCATDWKGGERRRQITASKYGVVARGQHLNPHFSAWLMGLPHGWISYAQLEMHKFRSWLRLHSVPCKGD